MLVALREAAGCEGKVQREADELWVSRNPDFTNTAPRRGSDGRGIPPGAIYLHKKYTEDMSIENPFNNPPEETPKPENKLTPEEEKYYEQWAQEEIAKTATTSENLRECEPEIAEFEEMVTSFELSHSLAELHLVIDLTPEEAPKHPVREPARVALIPIVTKLNTLKKETNISPEKHDELKAKYMHLSRAVGIINKNKVDHNR